MFITLVTSRSRKTRISVIILHLTIADLLVTFILLPTEVGNKKNLFFFLQERLGSEKEESRQHVDIGGDNCSTENNAK